MVDIQKRLSDDGLNASISDNGRYIEVQTRYGDIDGMSRTLRLITDILRREFIIDDAPLLSRTESVWWRNA